MKQRKLKRLTKLDETMIAIRAAKSFVSTLEFCIEQGEGFSAPIRVILDEPWKAAAYLCEFELRAYEEDGPSITKAAMARIRERARTSAKINVTKLFEEGKYSLEQIIKALPR